MYELSSGPHVGKDGGQLAVAVWSFREFGLETCRPESQGVAGAASGSGDRALALPH